MAGGPRRIEARFEALLESAPDGIVLVGADGRIVLVNRRAEELFGYRRDELLGEGVELLVPERFRGVHGVHRDRYGADPRTREMGAGLELYGRRRDGTEFPVEIALSPVREGDETLVISIVRDVTERRKAEEQRLELVRTEAALEELDAILHDVDAIIWEADSPERDTHTFVSGRVEGLFGHPEDRWLREPGFWRSVVHPDDCERVAREARRAVEPGERLELEYRLRAADGTLRWVRDIFRHVGAEAGRYRGVIVDVTESRELEARLLQSQKLEAIGQLAGGVAHDFNNLLTVISGYAERLAGSDFDAARRRDLGEIVRATERAIALTQQLLAFSRRGARSTALVDVNALVRGVREMLGRLIPEDIALTVHAAPGVDLVQGDRHQLEQVVVNLVLNARDAMPGGGAIRIETAAVDLDEHAARERELTAGRYVVLVVSDTGEGMTPEVQRRAFEPFFSTKEQGRGTGLGLSTAYGIVEQAAGKIVIESEPGRGTDVVVYLPAVAAAPPEADAPSAADAGTILLVEDEPALRTLARMTLEEARFAVLEARHGREALELAEHAGGRIDLLLTDVVMPDMGGPELAARLRELRPGIPVLFMSGYADSALARHSLEEAQVALLRKPFTRDLLLSRVREALTARSEPRG